MWGLYKGFGVNPSVTLQKESKLEYTAFFFNKQLIFRVKRYWLDFLYLRSKMCIQMVYLNNLFMLLLKRFLKWIINMLL